MSTNSTILLLGTNLGNKNNNLDRAKELINKEIGEIIKFSNILENEPEEFKSSNTFLNQKIEVITNLSPIKLLEKIKIIEYEIGRVYTKPKDGEKYIDRIIDIDILRFNNITFCNETLLIPHNQIFSRDFIKLLRFN